MDVFEAIKKRRSIRRFDQSKKVSKAQVNKILEAAKWAPSAGNLQSIFIYIVRDEKIKEKLYKATTGQLHVMKASVVFVVCADRERISYYGERGRSLYCIQDATIAVQNMWLALTGLGLGAVWVGAFDEEVVSQVLNVSSHHRPVAILPVGYPSESPKAPSRRSVEDFSKRV